MDVVTALVAVSMFSVGLLLGVLVGMFPVERGKSMVERILEKGAAKLNVGESTSIYVTVSKDREDDDEDDGGGEVESLNPIVGAFRRN